MTIKQMASGRMVNLTSLRSSDIDFKRDVAPALARICRFDGAMECASYSVAQHCVIMSDHALENSSDIALARACLLHDAHEAFCGDISTPVAQALNHFSTNTPTKSDHLTSVSATIDLLKESIDVAVFAAAGAPLPKDKIASELKLMDARMLETERIQLLCESSEQWATAGKLPPLKTRGVIRPWSIMDAEMAWLQRLSTLCPNAWEAPHWREL